MSRRKQSNPKPLKWEECWNETEDGESRLGKKIPGDSGHPGNSAHQSTSGTAGHEDSIELSSPRLRERSRSLKLTSGSCDVEISRIRGRENSGDTNWIKSSPKSEKCKSNRRGSPHPTDLEPEDSTSQNLSTDLTKRHDSLSLSQSPEISVSSTEHNGSPGPFSHHQILQTGLSYLHLLPPAIRNDASRYFMPHMMPPELAAAAAAASVSGIQQQSVGAKNEKVASAGDNTRIGQAYMCEPCGIKFSSARTLEAHQTYYCSFRKDNGNDGDKSVGGAETKSDSEVVGIKRERESSGEERELLIDESQDRDGNSNNMMNHSNILQGNKNIKTGKMYTCIYCSYSADKKVSLNRHMRMHSGASMPNSRPSSTQQQQVVVNSNLNEDHGGGASPSLSSYSSGKNIPSSDGGNGNNAAVERYCHDCDIQFSSIKTFRVHKQYYCSTRHVLKTQILTPASSTVVGQLKPSGSGVDMSNCSGSSTPGPARKCSGSPEGRSPTPGPGPATPIPNNQPFLVLPTNPVIIVPYCFVQGASILPGNILPNHNAIVVLPNGAVQGLPATPMMMSSPSHSLGAAAAAAMLLQQHPFSSGGNNMNSGGTVTSADLSPSGGGAHGVFNDPKDIIRRIGGKTGGRNPSDSDSQRSSSRCQSEKDGGDGDCCPELDVLSHHAPAIDLTLTNRGDDEKENRELMSGTAGRRIVRSMTPNDPDFNRELNSPNSERLSIGSGKSRERTPRPSSASLSSTCSSPPGHCFSDQHQSSVKHVQNGVEKSMRMGKSGVGSSQQQFTSPNSKGYINSAKDYNYNSNKHGDGNNLHSIATQLPGGAILTSTSNQSLAELLMSNPPELNESLAKLNSQLVMNSAAAAAAAAGGYNLPPHGAFPPELAMRLMDPAYLAALQHSFQQQQQQQQQQQRQQQVKVTTAVQQQQPQPPPVPLKRGVSKCVDCDIVFYKYENYLVHKERYCAARESVIGSKENQSLEFGAGAGAGAVKESISANSSPKSDGDGDDVPQQHGQGLSPPIQKQRGGSIGTRAQLQQYHAVNSRTLRKPSEASGEIMGNVNTSVSQTSPTKQLKVNSSVGGISPPGLIVNKDGKLHPSPNQYPCLKCGVKYSSFDNLQTHQTFYCNKRVGPDLNQSKSNGGENVTFPGAEQGFLRCGKCRLAIPEEQMNLHMTVCTPGIGAAGATGASMMTSLTSGTTGANIGWKCPCCETYSPTMSAAQKHLETHTGIRAFKCLLCGYRGNTLRGMRTHIRMHFDKRVSDLQEGDYIACITSKDLEQQAQAQAGSHGAHSSHGNSTAATVLTSAAAVAAAHAVTTAPPTATTIELNPVVKLERVSTTALPIVNHSPPMNHSATATVGSPPNSQSQLSPHDDMSTIRQVENNNRLHFCHLCNYSSSYKGNVVRHMKLVHKIGEDSAGDIYENEGMMGEERNGDLEESSCGSFSCRSPSQDIKIEVPVILANNNKTVIPAVPAPQTRKLVKVNGVATVEKRSSSRLSATAVDAVEEGTAGQIKKEKVLKHCKSCDVYFNYLSTYIAHKKLYCPSHGGVRVGSDSEPLEQRERAETPVQ